MLWKNGRVPTSQGKVSKNKNSLKVKSQEIFIRLKSQENVREFWEKKESVYFKNI